MKQKNYLTYVLLCFLMACGTKSKVVSSIKNIDEKLVGVWYGSEKDKQIEGIEKKWEMTRRTDGTFKLDFTMIQYGEESKTVEKGNWWVENGKFYEYHDVSRKTDVYKYEIIDKNHIKFVSISLSMPMEGESYEFIDTRKM